MKYLWNKYVFFICIVVLSLGVSACVLTPKEEENVFEKPEQQALVTLDGEIYPFSVSISTRATHRLANIDGKLIAYLYSDIVDLSAFETHVVEIDGYWKKEKMQEIFFVEAIRLQNTQTADDESSKTPNRFVTKRFTFPYQKNWEYSFAPDGVAHFIDKNDSVRKVFLMFSVEDFKQKELENPNISVSGMRGVRSIQTVAGRERQEIELFSNIFDKKYVFTFSGDDDQKKDFLTLINSFVEGEELVQKTIEDEKKLLAEREASKLKAKKEKEKLEKQLVDAPDGGEDVDQEEAPLLAEETSSSTNVGAGDVRDIADRFAPGETTTNPVISDSVEPFTEEEKKILLAGDFENLIDERAFVYESDYYNLKLKVPYGYWFRNFGPGDGTLFQIAFAKNEIQQPTDAPLWLYGVSATDPVKTVQERIKDGQLIIEFPRTNTSFFRFVGPVEFRDAMRSILLSVE